MCRVFFMGLKLRMYPQKNVPYSHSATQPLCQRSWTSHLATQPLSHSPRVAGPATQPLCQSGWNSHQPLSHSGRVAEWLSGWGDNFRHCAFNRASPYLVGGWATPLKNMKVRLDHHPNYWILLGNIKNDCNHLDQPVVYYLTLYPPKKGEALWECHQGTSPSSPRAGSGSAFALTQRYASVWHCGYGGPKCLVKG